jgi:hypothetical protein
MSKANPDAEFVPEGTRNIVVVVELSRADPTRGSLLWF